jgi:hypothetical protein
LNSPEIDGTQNIRASYQPAYQVKPPKLQHFPSVCKLSGVFPVKHDSLAEHEHEH